MKKLFSIALLAIFAFAINASAQSSLVATLNHEGEITVFYGADGFKKALNAAVHGDAITLSPGSFSSVNITKAVSIHGAGMTTDSVTYMEPTILTGNFDIEVPDATSHRFLMEGISNNSNITLRRLNNGQLLKCRFYRIYAPANDCVKNLSILHCRIASSLELTYDCSATLLNSIINNATGGHNARYSFTNCYVGTAHCDYSEYKNCVINHTYSADKNHSAIYSTYNNNILISDKDGAYLHTYNSQNNHVIKSSAAGNLANEYADNETYTLPENVKKLIKGTDGTEVGIYGGSFPYDHTPSNPQITKFSVAKKSTADGKLNVVIEINGEQ